MMMNGATEAELLLNCTDMSVLERQRAHLNYQHPGFDSTLAGFFSNSSTINGGEIDGFLATAGLELPAIYGETAMESDARLSISPANITTSMTVGSGNFKKRKFGSVVTETKYCNGKKMMNREGVVEEEEEEEEKSKITEQNNEITKSIMKNKAKKEQKDCSNDSSKATKTDYIHVRARRGQASDSHSIAERARREKISERMKYLQDLVPGCDKITGKAGMLDEIINYVQSLQRQVEFLSMKLAAVNPRLDFNIDDIFAKEVVSAPMTSLPNTVMPSHEMVNSGYPHEMVNSGYVHFNPMQQVVTISDPLSSFNNGEAPSMWDSDVRNLYRSLGV